MGWWSAYFFAKLLLYVGGYINFDVWWNLLFAIFTALPARNDRQRLTKNMIASVVSVLLLYHDSWLPPLARVLSQTQNLADFSLLYWVELLGRLISVKFILEATLLVVLYALLKRKLRMSTFVFIGIALVMLVPMLAGRVQVLASTSASGMTGKVEAGVTSSGAVADLRTLSADALNVKIANFYQQQQQRQVRFVPTDSSAAFDIVFLHVCSLSWDDLQQVSQGSQQLLQRFDVVFNQFNSAASYSGPAVIRLLRGKCGQTTHKQLYEPAPRECLVMDGLQDVGFEPHWLMNHDGHFGNFFADVRDRGGMPVALEDSGGAVVAQRSFDDTPIYDDYSVLSRWWQQRLHNPAAQVALYYNSISLHDGNRLEGKRFGSTDYATRLTSFAKDLNHFVDDVQRSGRHVIVVLVPEHGAAVRGDKRQMQGLREIPTHAITQVPVAVMLVNALGKSADAAVTTVDAPVSYLALNELLARFMTDNPFAKTNLSLTDYVQGLSQTDSLAENDGTLMVTQGKQAVMRTPDGAWSNWGET
jgi:cellulose synthase operon protein YhjU